MSQKIALVHEQLFYYDSYYFKAKEYAAALGWATRLHDLLAHRENMLHDLRREDGRTYAAKLLMKHIDAANVSIRAHMDKVERTL